MCVYACIYKYNEQVLANEKLIMFFLQLNAVCGHVNTAGMY